MGSNCSNCSQCQKDKLEQINEVTITKKSESNKIVISSNSQLSYQNNSHFHKQKSIQSFDETQKQTQKLLLLSKMAIVIQKQWKGYKARKAYLQTKQCLKKPQNDQATIDSKSKRNIQKYFIQEEYGLKINPEQLQREFRSKYEFISGSTYEGEWLGDKRDGYGIQIWEDGAKYIGQWKNNQACGQGTFYHVDGDIYEGQWECDRANGFGIYRQSNGVMYQGQWKDDYQHGQGQEKCIRILQKKQGSIIRFMRVNIFKVRSREEGFINGQMEVILKESGLIIRLMGEYIWADGRKYKGIWKDNKMHGYGIYQWSDGRSYHGEYVNDKKQGKGKYFWPDGKIFEGEWYEGKQNGRGKYLMADGKVKFGFWENGKRINIEGQLQ